MPTKKNNEKKGVATAADQEAEMERLRSTNAKLQGALDAIRQQAEEKNVYYNHLVWSARRTVQERRRHAPNFYQRVKKDLKNNKKLYQKWKGDEAELQTEGGDWHHGFNSGCLAMSRLMMGLSVTEDEVHEDGDEEFRFTVEDQRQQVLEEFPCLDT